LLLSLLPALVGLHGRAAAPPPAAPGARLKVGVTAFYLPETEAAALEALARRTGVPLDVVLGAILFRFDQLDEETRAQLVWEVLRGGEEA
jgi:hypothetical protein